MDTTRQSHGSPTSRYINLNVGGVKYTTSQETLTRYQDSMLGHMFTQENIPLAKDEQGCFMIDRDGRLFSYILNYLRDGELTLPKGFNEHKQLLKEARFYQLNALEEELNDAITTPTHVTLIVGGVKYLTTKATLTKYPESVLSRMFTETISGINRDEYGHFNIDRDGILFRYILNFLRDDKMGIPADFSETEQLIQEVRFYELSRYVRKFGVRVIAGGAHFLISEETWGKLPYTFRMNTQRKLEINMSSLEFKVIIDYLEGRRFNVEQSKKQEILHVLAACHVSRWEDLE